MGSVSKVIDHINRNQLDNRVENLRVCNSFENNTNVAAHRDSKTKYKGVNINKDRFRARFRFYGKEYLVGIFYTVEYAVHMYNRKVKEIQGEFAYVNPIEMSFEEAERREKEAEQRTRISKYKNIVYQAPFKKWIAKKTINGKVWRSSKYKTEEEAYQALQNKLKECGLSE